jgi:hypothetical protein
MRLLRWLGWAYSHLVSTEKGCSMNQVNDRPWEDTSLSDLERASALMAHMINGADILVDGGYTIR